MTVGVPRFAPVIAGPADMRVFGFPAAAERRPGGNGHRRGRRGHTRGTALGAAPDTMADVSIAQVPGIPRTGYFRLLECLAAGEATWEEVMQHRTATATTSSTARHGPKTATEVLPAQRA